MVVTACCHPLAFGSAVCLPSPSHEGQWRCRWGGGGGGGRARRLWAAPRMQAAPAFARSLLNVSCARSIDLQYV